jgi:hypothetical protein
MFKATYRVFGMCDEQINIVRAHILRWKYLECCPIYANMLCVWTGQMDRRRNDDRCACVNTIMVGTKSCFAWQRAGSLGQWIHGYGFSPLHHQAPASILLLLVLPCCGWLVAATAAPVCAVLGLDLQWENITLSLFVSLVYRGWKYYSLVYYKRKTLLDGCWFGWIAQTNDRPSTLHYTPPLNTSGVVGRQEL